MACGNVDGNDDDGDVNNDDINGNSISDDGCRFEVRRLCGGLSGGGVSVIMRQGISFGHLHMSGSLFCFGGGKSSRTSGAQSDMRHCLGMSGYRLVMAERMLLIGYSFGLVLVRIHLAMFR
mmetsp:Transcript_64920/g.76835  ORF Transcript_64920/g.76835 Transcript_64920/m.76835 type:complete len:121 (-) Transcript_64920:298-660(-)